MSPQLSTNPARTSKALPSSQQNRRPTQATRRHLQISSLRRGSLDHSGGKCRDSFGTCALSFLVTSIRCEVPFVFRVGAGINSRHWHHLQVRIDVHEGKDAVVTESRHKPVAAYPCDGCLDRKRRAASVSDLAGEVQLVSHTDWLIEVDSTRRYQQRTVICDHLRAYVGIHICVMDHMAAEDGLRYILIFWVCSFPAACYEVSCKQRDRCRGVQVTVEFMQKGVFFERRWVNAAAEALRSSLGRAP